MPKIKVKGQTVQPWECWQTHGRTDATKCIISLASRSIIMLELINWSSYRRIRCRSWVEQTGCLQWPDITVDFLGRNFPLELWKICCKTNMTVGPSKSIDISQYKMHLCISQRPTQKIKMPFYTLQVSFVDFDSCEEIPVWRHSNVGTPHIKTRLLTFCGNTLQLYF